MVPFPGKLKLTDVEKGLGTTEWPTFLLVPIYRQQKISENKSVSAADDLIGRGFELLWEGS